MSHFTVLVIGDDPEAQLAPYNENIEVPPYIDGELTDVDKQRFIDYYTDLTNTEKDKRKSKSNMSAKALRANLGRSFEDLYQEYGEQWNSRRWKLDEKDGKWYEWSTYSPCSKWDWYELGGRWSGYFKVKKNGHGTLGQPGIFDNKPTPGYVDQLRYGDVDWEGMREDATHQALEVFGRVKDAIAGLPMPENWSTFRERYPEDIDRARKEYHAQPAVKALEKAELSPLIHCPVDRFCNFDEMKFIEKVRRECIEPFAVVKDGTWYESAKMGFWAMTRDEKPQEEWTETVNKLLDSCTPDTLLSLFDCHI